MYRNDQPMMGCGVTEGADGGTCQREIVDQEQARLLCLEYTFVLSIFLLLSVTTLSMSSKSYFFLFKQCSISTHRQNEGKPPH